VDSDGSIRIGKRESAKGVSGVFYHLRISIQQHRNDNLFDWLLERFGGCNDNVGKMPGWTVAAKNAEEFIGWILPYVIVRREECELALEFIKTLRSRHRARLSQDVLDVREVLYLRSAVLKHSRYNKGV